MLDASNLLALSSCEELELALDALSVFDTRRVVLSECRDPSACEQQEGLLRYPGELRQLQRETEMSAAHGLVPHGSHDHVVAAFSREKRPMWTHNVY